MGQRAASAGAASATMRAVVVTQPGGLDAREVTTLPMPEPQPGWVRIKVKAFSVNESEVTTDLPAQVFQQQLHAIAAGRLKAPVEKVHHGLDQLREADVEAGTTPTKPGVLLDD
ncbi:hypothetical protein [Streptomyces massasporeus]|uniref:hypothetical protein n=1 Tax=Streptomyces massasporeus TaxID=67324 RepID=UPI0019AD2097|nr:hypothetical protein [Streptomyces massasporeus]GGV58483.1 hypothetical protein GCM10010228_04240 [Streptomyces massasporeus]